MNLLNFIKRILARFINIPRKIRQVYYICWNYFMLWANGVEIGKNMKIYNRIYLTKHPTAQVIIGNNLVFISGDGFNPLCRNLRGCIYAGEGAKIKIGNDVGISSACIRAKQYIKYWYVDIIGYQLFVVNTVEKWMCFLLAYGRKPRFNVFNLILQEKCEFEVAK